MGPDPDPASSPTPEPSGNEIRKLSRYHPRYQTTAGLEQLAQLSSLADMTQAMGWERDKHGR